MGNPTNDSKRDSSNKWVGIPINDMRMSKLAARSARAARKMNAPK
jgi:hypothetical protein